MGSTSGYQRCNRATYDKLLESFRGDGANITAAARLAGVDWKTADRAYKRGWQGKPWARPIREVLEEERQRALAVVAERIDREKQLAEAARAQATQVAVEAKVQEELILTRARKVVADVLGDAIELRTAMGVLVKVVHAKIRDAVLDANGQPKPAAAIDIDVELAMKIIDRHTRMSARVVSVAEGVIQLGRTERGEANLVVGHTVADMTAEEAAEEIEAQEQAIAIIRSEGSVH
jgi:hypothetical protein